MEASRKSDAITNPKPPCVANSEQGDVVVLGEPSAPGETAVHPEAEPTIQRPVGKINVKSVLQLLEYQGYRCALTGRHLTPDEASLDHIVPVRDGGEHVIENAQILHRDVNRAKSVLSHDAFVQLCREVSSYAG